MTKKIATFVLTMILSSPIFAMSGYWVATTGGAIPAYAQQVGQQANGAALFLCRAQFQGVYYTGNLNPAFQGCSIAANGVAVTLGSYEVFVTAAPQAVVVAAPVAPIAPQVIVAPAIVAPPPVAIIAGPIFPRPAFVAPVVVNRTFVVGGGHGHHGHHGGHHGGHHHGRHH
jgi:hypothetical protein